MDKVDLNAKLLLYIKQGNRTSLRTPEVDMLKEENARLSDKVDQLSKEKKILEKENFILKNMGAGSSALGKHTRSSEEELDDVKNKKRKLEREIKELEYRKEDLEDTIKVLEKKTVWVLRTLLWRVGHFRHGYNNEYILWLLDHESSFGLNISQPPIVVFK